MRSIMWVLAAALVGGCSGEYILTAPDVVVPAGENAPVVVRLQRREVLAYAPPQEDSAITFRLDGKVLRCARTDKAGYAAVSIEAPGRPGRYAVAMFHQDTRGDVATGEVAIYVLDPAGPVAVVDMDSLPRAGQAVAAAAEAIERIGRSVQVIYVTEKYAGRPARAHELLRRCGYPDGPVGPYGKERQWYQKWRRAGQTSALDELRRRLPKLQWGITADAAAAEAFAAAALKVLVVGKAKAEEAERFGSWADLELISSP